MLALRPLGTCRLLKAPPCARRRTKSLHFLTVCCLSSAARSLRPTSHTARSTRSSRTLFPPGLMLSRTTLTVEQTREAKQGASYASDEYEKWKTAYKKAKADLEATLARHAEERTSLGEEREVIKEILRYLGVLHDVKATEKSIAAGGRDSKIDEETGVSEVKAVKTATLKAKMAKLQSLVLKRKPPGCSRRCWQTFRRVWTFWKMLIRRPRRSPM